MDRERARPIHLPGPAALEKMIVQRDEMGCPHEFHTPLENPVWLSADQDGHMRPEDPVLGILLDRGAWAIPWWIIKNHHVANLMLERCPIMVVL